MPAQVKTATSRKAAKPKLPARPIRSKTAAPTVDLRQRILESSERLLEEGGVGALSLRDVARRAGVTHQAPYHHFADRESIVAELVTIGFDDLAQRLARANAVGDGGDRRAMLVASNEAYVGFAIDRPGLFRVMFRPELCDVSRFPLATAAADRAYGELLELVRLLHGDAVSEELAHVYWSQVHGLAGLIVDGPIGFESRERTQRLAKSRATAKRFADMVLGKGDGNT